MWFDSSNIASFAKNALKEAQKKIDKALDIQDEGQDEINRSKSEKNSATETKNLENIWGSFNGSFFENPKVTTPITDEQPRTRKSETSSESLEILSSPNSGITTPQTPISTVPGSEADESVEVVSVSRTPSILDISSPDEFLSDSLKTPENIEVITDEDSESIKVSDEFKTASSPITIAPSKSGLHLSLSKTSNFESINLTDNNESCALLSTSDNTLTTSETESFYEATKDELDQTLIDPNYMEKSMESFEIQTQVSDSTHSFEEVPKNVGNLASQSKEPKKASGSGHTSGDELETATSSDIEIISSPNGDSSSTNSFNKISPSKIDNFPYKNSEMCLSDLRLENVMRKQGHSRELSEVSVLSDDSNISETEKLLKRISELSETLEQREFKLVQIVENNTQLLSELDKYKKKGNHMDMSNIQEEYTQRLSALEKKFQQSIRENSAIKKLNETLRSDLLNKISKEDHEKIVSDKDNVICTLQREGEKLSKDVLKNSNIIKVLRSKIKENEDILKKNSNEINDLSEENKTLKRNLTAKEEIEKSQSEGINRITSEKRKLEKEIQTLKSDFEDLEQKYQATLTSYEAIKKEMSEKNLEITKNLESEKEKILLENKQILKELNDMRIQLRENETAATNREQKLIQENFEVKRKLEETEFRIEDQQQAASLATIPLIRQLESLQSTLNSRATSFENQEKNLLEKLEEAQNKLKSQSEVEKSARDQVAHLNLKISNLEEKLSFTALKLEQANGQHQQKQIEYELKENDFKKCIEKLNRDLDLKGEEFNKMKNLVDDLEKKLRLERELHEEEKRKFAFIQQPSQNEQEPNNPLEPSFENNSPTLSLGEESLHSNQWNVVSF